MKSSLSKLRKIALHKSTVAKEKNEFQPSPVFDELALAAKVLSLSNPDVTVSDCSIELASIEINVSISRFDFSFMGFAFIIIRIMLGSHEVHVCATIFLNLFWGKISFSL